MSNFIKQVYQCSDGRNYDDFESAWNHERRTKFPDILMFDCFGGIVDDVKVAANYIVNNAAEADFVEDYLQETEEAIIYDKQFVMPHSWITTAMYDNDYILYPPERYKDEDTEGHEEILNQVRQYCDLWDELLGQ